jgi:hypothetical protein
MRLLHGKYAKGGIPNRRQIVIFTNSGKTQEQ